VHDLVHTGCWDTHPAAPAAAPDGGLAQEWMTRDADNLDEEAACVIQLAGGHAWERLPAGLEPAWSGAIELRARTGEPATVHLLGGRLDGEDRLLVAGAPDGSGARPLGRGDWSDWIRLTFGGACGS